MWNNMATCPFCGKMICEDWVACPYCHNLFKCPNCKSEILKEWGVCPYCAEILGNNFLAIDKNKNYVKRVILPNKTLSEKLVSKFPLPHYISWAIVGINLFSIFYLFQIRYGGSVLIIPVAILCYLIAMHNIIMIWISKSFENLYYSIETSVNMESSELEDWYEKNLTRIFDLKKSLLLGFLIGIVGCITLLISPHSEFSSFYIALAFYLIAYMALCTMGSGLYFMFTTAKLTSEISKLKIKVSIYQHPNKSIKYVGKVFFKIFSVIVLVVYLPWLVAFLFSPWELNIFILLWFILIGIYAFLYFIIPQYTIHKCMVAAKKNKEIEVGDYLNIVATKYALNPSPLNINRLNELNQLKETIAKMGEWPFDIKSALSIIGSILLPLILILIEIMRILNLLR